MDSECPRPSWGADLRTVLFDVDGVLIHGYHARDEKRRRWDEHLETDLGIDAEAFRDRFIKGVFQNEVLTGRRAFLPALEEVLPSIGYKASPLSVMSYWLGRDSQLNLPLIDVVRRVRQRCDARMCVATNQEHVRAFHLWTRLGFENLFDDIFYSARLGAAKPDRGFYERVMQIIGPQDEPPLLFDDSEAVVQSARAFGWEAALYDDLADCVSHPWISGVLSR